MISIKDYAKESGVTYEAVRQRVKRYEVELEGHIHRQGRTQFLDDVAVAFLNEHRIVNPTVVYDRAAGEEFRELKDELKDAREQLKAKDGLVKFLVEENKDLRLQASSVARLEADNAKANQRAAEAENKAQEAARELQKRDRTIEEMREELGDLLKGQMEQEERLQAWKKYAEDLEEYNALGWFKRLKAERPVAPVFSND